MEHNQRTPIGSAMRRCLPITTGSVREACDPAAEAAVVFRMTAPPLERARRSRAWTHKASTVKCWTSEARMPLSDQLAPPHWESSFIKIRPRLS
eukprot:gene12392-biopygen565